MYKFIAIIAVSVASFVPVGSNEVSAAVGSCSTWGSGNTAWAYCSFNWWGAKQFRVVAKCRNGYRTIHKYPYWKNAPAYSSVSCPSGYYRSGQFLDLNY